MYSSLGLGKSLTKGKSCSFSLVEVNRVKIGNHWIIPKQRVEIYECIMCFIQNLNLKSTTPVK